MALLSKKTSDPVTRRKISSRTPVKVEPSQGARRDLLAAQFLQSAAALFAAKGFAATSLKDVADALGMTRSSIYHYYPNKEALLEEIMRGVTVPVARIFADVNAEYVNPLERIREVVRRLVLWVADPVTHFRLLDRSEAELPESIAKLHVRAKRQILSEMIKLVDAAVTSGEARNVDARVTSLSIIGMAMWTAWWFKPNQDQKLEFVANEIAENALASLRRAKSVQRIESISDLTAEIRENLALIDGIASRNKV